MSYSRFTGNESIFRAQLFRSLACAILAGLPLCAQTPSQVTSDGGSKERLLFLPNFLTLDDVGKAPRMTAEQKFKVALRTSFDYVEYPWYGFLAGIGQWQNSEKGYGQGAGGYLKRFGSQFGDGTMDTMMTAAVLPSLLHQDPRFYQTGRGTFRHRLGYALSRMVVTRSDAGREEFNYSEVFGSAMAASISTFTYHPRGERNLSNAASVWASEFSYDTLTTVMKEFWPDIQRKMFHKGQQKDSRSD